MPKQVSIFAENKPGKIERITKVLLEAGISIRATTIADSGDYGIVKLLLDNPEAGCEALAAAGIAASLRQIVAVRIEDRPGGLHAAAAVLSEQGINVEDAYGFMLQKHAEAIFVFQVQDQARVEKILAERGFTVLRDNELYDL